MSQFYDIHTGIQFPVAVIARAFDDFLKIISLEYFGEVEIRHTHYNYSTYYCYCYYYAL